MRQPLARQAHAVAVAVACLCLSLPSAAQILIPADTDQYPVPDPRERKATEVQGLAVEDVPDDDATALKLSWEPPTGPGLSGYIVSRSADPGGPDEELARLDATATEYVDSGFDWGADARVSIEGQPTPADPRGEYYYRVQTTGPWDVSPGAMAGPASPEERWLNFSRFNMLVAVTLCVGLFWLCVNMAKRGAEMYIRPVAGLEALTDAIGRATEMGKPILFSTGMGKISIQESIAATLAATTILGRVAQMAAEQGTRVIVPNVDPLIMSAQQEVVKDAYLQAGRPEAYREDDLFYPSDAQFAYAAAVTGWMLRERPAAGFYLGYFEAESLILAETGASIGSIQIAGTDQVFQLPFFVTACDYTLIGEELFAATAYLSREPPLLGSLRAQDWFKLMLAASIVVGMLLTCLGALGAGWAESAGTWFAERFVTK